MKNTRKKLFALIALAMLLAVSSFPQGFARAASFSAFNTILASGYTSQSGTQLESSSEGGQNVAFIDNGDYIAFDSINFGTGASSVQFRVASNTTGGNIEVRLGSLNGTLAATCSVPNTGGWQNWVTRTCTTSNISGTHHVFLKFTGGAGNLFNIHNFKFTAASGGTGNDVVGHIFAGYQGWFTAGGDGSPLNNWTHWTKNGNSPTPNSNVNFELYPDLRSIRICTRRIWAIWAMDSRQSCSPRMTSRRSTSILSGCRRIILPVPHCSGSERT